MEEKPKVGLVIIRTNQYDCLEAEEVLAGIRADVQNMVELFSRHFTIAGPWVIDTPEMLQSCQRALRETDIDLVLLAYQTLADDTHLAPLLQAVGSFPLILWCYLPWRRLPRPATFGEVLRASGPVGAFAALGTLRNLGARFLFTFGAPDDPRLIRDLQVAGRAARTRQALRTARFGLIPSGLDRMQCTYVDENRLMADFGPLVQYISVDEYQQAAEKIPQAQIDTYLKTLQGRYQIVGVSEETQMLAARAALGLARLAEEHRLDLLALDDSAPALRRAVHLRPALYPDLSGQGKTLYQPEGDLGAATANFVLHYLTGSPTLFLEIWYWDEAKNLVIGGHGGAQNLALAEPDQVFVSRDYEFCQYQNVDHAITSGAVNSEGGVDSEGTGPSERTGSSEGAQIQLIAHPGRVTLFQLRSTPDGWQAIAASGVCLEGLPWVEGYPHAVVRLDAPLEHFLNRLADVGTTPHWVMAYGSVMHELEAFCQMEHIPLELLSY